MSTELQTVNTNGNEDPSGKQAAAKPLLFVPDFSEWDWTPVRNDVKILELLLEGARVGFDWEQCRNDEVEEYKYFFQGVVLASTDAFSAKEQFCELMQRSWFIFMSALGITKKRDPLVYQLLLEVFNYGLGEVKYAKPKSHNIALDALLFKQDLAPYKEAVERITVQSPRNGLAWGILALASSEWDIVKKDIMKADKSTYIRQCLINMAEYHVPEESITLLTNRLLMKGWQSRVFVAPANPDDALKGVAPEDLEWKTRFVNNWKYSATIGMGCLDHIAHWPFTRTVLNFNARNLPEVERCMIVEGELPLADLKRFNMETTKRASGCCIWLLVAGTLPFAVWKLFGLLC